MASFLSILFTIALFSIAISAKKTLTSYTSALSIIRAHFSNVSIVYSDSRITLCRGDKSGENFLFALRGNSAFSLQDIETLYEKAEKLHIHNRIIITDYSIDNTVSEKKLKEYEIDVWDTSKLASISTPSTSNPADASVLKTSDTSDDTCYIEENSDDPIKDGAFHTHSIFSIFNNKTEHL